MSDHIPPEVHSARTPDELIDAAKKLHGVNAPQAIEPLALLNRRATGYWTMAFSLVVALLLSLTGGWLVYFVINTGLQTLGRGLFLIGSWLYPGWEMGWWLALTGLAAFWFWQDKRLRGLLRDPRFELAYADLTWLWYSMLWPVRLLAWGARLAVAMLFLLPQLALPVVTVMTLGRIGTDPGFQTQPDERQLYTLGLSAAALLVAFGLFVFSDWPRTPSPARSFSARQTWLRFGLALALAGGLGWVVWRLAPEYGEGPGIFSGVCFFMLFNWFLRARTPGSLTASGWRQAVKQARVTTRQLGFLKFLLFFLGVMGIGILALELAGHSRIMEERWLVAWVRWAAGYLGYFENPPVVLVAMAVAASLGVLAFLYTLGIGVVLARLAAWPYFALRVEALGMMSRLRARRAIRETLRFHRVRNRDKVAGRGERAVCRDHQARFEPQWAKLSYGRRWRYWWCRKCRSDQSVFANVKTVTGVFNYTMDKPVEQAGEALRVNLLKRSVIPLDLDEVVVERVDDQHAVEGFVVDYQNYTPPVKKRPLKEVRLRVEPNSGLDDNWERLLRKQFRT